MIEYNVLKFMRQDECNKLPEGFENEWSRRLVEGGDGYMQRNKPSYKWGMCPERGWVGWWMSTWGVGLLRFPKSLCPVRFHPGFNNRTCPKRFSNR